MTTVEAAAVTFSTALAAAVRSEMLGAGLTVTALATGAQMSPRKLARRLSDRTHFTITDLGAVGLVLGRRPSDFVKIAEQQQGVDSTDTP